MAVTNQPKKLYECDPKELELSSLSDLQTSLMAKLFLVNQELIFRYRQTADLSPNIPGTENAKTVITESVNHLEKVNAFLQAEIARITGKIN